MIRSMASPAAPDAHHLQLLAVLVEQRRTTLELGKEEAAKECGLAPMTYRAVAEGRPARASTYAKIERRFGMAPDSCKAVLAGADSIRLLDGTEIVDGGVIRRHPLKDVEAGVKQAVTKAASLTAPDITLAQADDMGEAVVKELQRLGILPSAP